MRIVLAFAAALAVLAPDVARAQWADDPIENTRTERRVARDAAFVGAVVGTVGLLITVPLVIGTAVDEPAPGDRRGLVDCAPMPCTPMPETFEAAHARWETQIIASAIVAGISLAALTVSILTFVLVPSPDDPVQASLRLGPGGLSLAGSF